MIKLKKKEVEEFLKESNAIERVYDEFASNDAIKAWEYALRNKDSLSLSRVLDVHKILIARLDPEIAGKVRNCPVRIGYEIKKFISIQLIEDDIRKWLKKYGNLQKGDWKRAHIEFEDIHPFIDGNGRTGRILMNIHRLNLGLPLMIIHEGGEQYEYYKWFGFEG